LAVKEIITLLGATLFAVRKLLIAIKSHFKLWNVPDWFPARIQERFPELRVVWLRDFDRLEEEISDAEVVVAWMLTAEQLAKARKLKWLHSNAAGVNQLCFPEMVAHPAVLTNASPVMAEPTAEHALALILAMAKQIPSSLRYQQKSTWAQALIYEETPPLELNGATLGLVGLGAIGRELVTRVRAFRMRVVAVKRDATRGHEWADKILPPDGLHEILAESDFVVLAAPHTAHTVMLIGAAELARMKPTAYLINVARGTLVDETALVEALRAGRIAGAGLDVASEEPLPKESILWDAPNLLLTPHLAASTDRLWSRHAELLEDNIRRYLAGQPLRNVVDKAAGY
jgi:phosphoglycerate dehydrogenase-like enzyme